MSARENRPTEGAVHEVPTKGPALSVQHQDDISRDQLGRLETVLDSIVRTLTPLAGAR